MEGTTKRPGRNRIFLVGFMGSGKTHWGKIWAEVTGLDFYDLDEEIESKAGMSVSAIFETHGEGNFRELEKTELREFEKKENFILACGGGTPCFSDNLAWMKSAGRVLYLKAAAETIASHLKEERQKRPLISQVPDGGLLAFIGEKLRERESYYNQADQILEVSQLGPGSLDHILGPGR